MTAMRSSNMKAPPPDSTRAEPATEALRRKLQLLVSAGTALSAWHLPSDALTQTRDEATTIQFQYHYYEDWQQGGEDRISVSAPQFLIKTPIGESSELEAGIVYDSVSGASPLYHDTLTGASGKGIEDNRIAGDITGRTYFEDFSIGAGLTASHEDDYDSLGGVIEGQVWNDSKTRTYAFGVSGHSDDISSTNNPDLEEDSRTFGQLIGLTQVIDKLSLLQTNLTFSTSDGYLSDPYKLSDNRPRSRERYAWLIRYIRHLEDWEASLHADYRLYLDSWGISSHTTEVSLYQPIAESWMIRPSLRLYTQSKADFYDKLFPPRDLDSFFSADQRLSGFGAITAGLKVMKDLGNDLSLNVGADLYQQRGEWRVFGKGSPDLDPFSALFVTFGFEKKFK